MSKKKRAIGNEQSAISNQHSEDRGNGSGGSESTSRYPFSAFHDRLVSAAGYLRQRLWLAAAIGLLTVGALGASLKYLEEDARTQAKLPPDQRSLLSMINPFLASPLPALTQLSKEYIYAGSRLLAIEDAAGPTPTPTPPPAPARASSFVSQSVPTSLQAGQSAAVSVTFTNTGTATWKSGEFYSLGSRSMGDVTDNVTWGFSRVVLPHDVTPGNQVTFNFTITAPSDPGTYNFQWRMV